MPRWVAKNIFWDALPGNRLAADYFHEHDDGQQFQCKVEKGEVRCEECGKKPQPGERVFADCSI